MYTVYMHTCIITDKKYVGITCREPWTRRFNGDGSGYKNCIHFWNAIQKYGWENFTHEILEICETMKEANKLEHYYIAFYKTNNPEFGYNIKTGGEHQKYPDEVCKRISEAKKGKASRPAGWKHSEETIEKIIASQKGRPLSPEHAAHVRVATREYYKTHSPSHTFTKEDHIAAIEACSVKVRIVETGEVFNTMTDCANHMGVLVSNLSRAIKQNRKYKGYHIEKVCL